MWYGDWIKTVEGKPVPRIGRYGLVICGWCGSRVEPRYTDPDAPWLCDDCGISRRSHLARVSSAPRQPTALMPPPMVGKECGING